MSRRSKQKNYSSRARKREHEHFSGNAGYGGMQAGIPREYNGDKVDGNTSWDRYRQAQLSKLPQLLPRDPNKRYIDVFVEGYEDVSFWRGIFDDYESEHLSFTVSVPPRADLAKGKKVIMQMAQDKAPNQILCVDSDFDYLFGKHTEQSSIINDSEYIFHTYAYSTENFLCYAPSLHNVCVKATKNDSRIFDFDKFLKEYSRIIHPLFLWYAYSAQLKNENVFTLMEFKSSVKLNYLEVENNGEGTLRWLERQVSKRCDILERNRPGWDFEISEFSKQLAEKGLTPDQTYLFMQGHTLMDNVVIVMLSAVCEQLKSMSNIRITTSTKTGTALRNETSNYNNSLRNVRDVLLDNEQYKECRWYKRLQQDIESYIAQL